MSEEMKATEERTIILDCPVTFKNDQKDYKFLIFELIWNDQLAAYYDIMAWFVNEPYMRVFMMNRVTSLERWNKMKLIGKNHDQEIFHS